MTLLGTTAIFGRESATGLCANSILALPLELAKQWEQSTMRLDGKTAFVTGGTQGVGAAIAIRLARAGCDLVLHGLRQDSQSDATTETCLDCGVDARCVFQDLSTPATMWLDSLIDRTRLPVGRLPDILVNNAGVFCDRPFLQMDQRTLDVTFGVNVAAGYFLTQQFARDWIEHDVAGRVLFTSSINGQLAEPDHTAYDASKGAVNAMVRSMCVALAPHNIRVNAMAPGLVKTPLTATVLEADPQVLAWMKLHTPNGRVPGPEACGGTALFLLSDEAEHIQGQTILVDGGMSAWQQPDLPPSLRSK